MPDAVIPYYPRPIWRDVIHPALEKKNRAVLVCHRRFGKTVGSINEVVKKSAEEQKARAAVLLPGTVPKPGKADSLGVFKILRQGRARREDK